MSCYLKQEEKEKEEEEKEQQEEQEEEVNIRFSLSLRNIPGKSCKLELHLNFSQKHLQLQNQAKVPLDIQHYSLSTKVSH